MFFKIIFEFLHSNRHKIKNSLKHCILPVENDSCVVGKVALMYQNSLFTPNQN